MKKIPKCVICKSDKKGFAVLPVIDCFISSGEVLNRFKDIKEKVLLTCDNGNCEGIYLFDPLTNDMELTTASWSKDADSGDFNNNREVTRTKLCKKWGAKVIK